MTGARPGTLEVPPRYTAGTSPPVARCWACPLEELAANPPAGADPAGGTPELWSHEGFWVSW